MAEHSDLTGNSLHEPKGVDNASAGEAYIADGNGTGTWTNPLSSVKNLNIFTVEGRMADVSTAGSNVYFPVYRAATLNIINLVISGPITTANAVISIYKNGVLQGQTVTINFSGSTAGKIFTLNLNPTYTFAAGDVIELRTDGGSTDAQFLDISCVLQAV